MIGPVLFVSGMAGASRRYRCTHHQEQLALQGISSTLRETDDLELLLDAIGSPIIILQRVPFSPLIEALVQIAKATGHLLIFETDDLTFDPNLVGGIRFLDKLPVTEAEAFRANVRGQFETLSHCDFLLTSTTPILSAATRLGHQGEVHPNAFSAAMADASDRALDKRRSQAAAETDKLTREIVLGYFSGTPTHDHDLASIGPALAAIFQRFPQVKLQIVGPARLDRELGAFAKRISRQPVVPWEELPRLIAEVDINVAPLEPGNPFCDAKSELKYLEAALVGIPTIASHTPAFLAAITPDVTGLLADTVEHWEKQLSRLIEDADFRQRLGNAAYEHVRQTYSPSARSETLVKTLSRMQAEAREHRSQPAPGLTPVEAVELIRGPIRQLSATAHDNTHRWHSLHKVSGRLLQLLGSRSVAAIRRLLRRD